MTTRRQFLKTNAMIGTAVLAGPALIGRASAAGETIFVADPGGVVTEVFKQTIYDPFTKATGIRVEAVVREAQAHAQIKSMVETRNYVYDAVLGAGADEAVQYNDAGLADEIPIPKAMYDDILPPLRGIKNYIPDAVAAFATVYRPSATKRPLTSVADMWNASIPGVRSLRNGGRDNIEWALRADGVPAGDAIIRELQTEAGWKRAFKKLDEIKPRIRTWWTAAPQSAQLLLSQEIDITPTYTNRAFELVKQGEDLAVLWKQGYYTSTGWIIPKGNPKAELVHKLVVFALDPERQAARATRVGTGAVSAGASKFLTKFTDEKGARMLPTHPDNFKELVPLDTAFWGQHLAQSNERFTEWLVKS